jgi:hypothetical protein
MLRGIKIILRPENDIGFVVQSFSRTEL